MGQLSFERELFADTTSVRERTWDWLTTRYRTVDGKPTGVSDAVRPFFDRIFDQFGDSEAVERCKCLDVLENPYCQLHGWKPTYVHASYYLGLFDHTIKYHVCWARAAAARAGATPDVAVGVFEQTDYREGRQKFTSLIGHVVFDEEKERTDGQGYLG